MKQKTIHEERIEKALELACRYGQIDGDHHKTWVIDQMVRALTGSVAAYHKLIAEWNTEDGDPNAYEWDTGIAP